MQPPTSHNGHDDEISLMEIFTVLWSGRWLIILSTLVAAALTTGAAFLIPKSYTATVVLAPVSDSTESQLGGLANIASEFGGLASLAGISLSGGSGTAEAIAVLQSESLTTEYIQKNNLLPILFEEDWDATSNSWRNKNPQRIPTAWKANEVFKRDVRSVTENTKTGLVTLRITWKDAAVAAKWANEIVQQANDHLRQKAIEQSERNITFLKEQADKTSNVELRQRIYAVLQTEITKAMMAQGTIEFAFRVLDPAVPPERHTSPRKSFWLLGGALVGALLSTAYVALRRRSGFRTSPPQ